VRKTSSSFRRRSAPVAFNATPLVDMIFTLSIFFMLVTRFSSAEQVPMQLPSPKQSQAEVVKLPSRIIINCRPADPTNPRSGAVLFSIGPNRPETLDVIADRLAALKRQSSGVQVVLRADKRLSYGEIRAVMHVIAANDIDVLNVVAHVSEAKER
jgi:biopolymer transport protein ExbD